MSRGNLNNYHALETWLHNNDIDYHKLNEHQYRIFGDAAMVDVWPARMTVHVLHTEGIDPGRYFRLSYVFDGDELKQYLDGANNE